MVMVTRRNFLSCLIGTAVFLVSGQALATGNPAGTVTIAIDSLAVPALTDNLLLALGFLLIALAVRALRHPGFAHKAVAWVVLAGGLGVGGIGVERTVASVTIITAMDEVCTTGGTLPSFSMLTTQPPRLDNGCSVRILVTHIDLMWPENCPGGVTQGTCTVGTGLSGWPGEPEVKDSCTLPICTPLPP